MFEIPDDDDNFWEDLPLNDINNENVTPVKIPESGLQKKQPCSFNQNNLSKRRCVTSHEQPQENQGRQFQDHDIASGQHMLSPERDSDGGYNASRNNNYVQGQLSKSLRGPCLNIPAQPSRVLVPFTQEVVLPRESQLTRPRTPSGDTSVSDASHSNNGRPSNKRKRKFPGPAGLLPKLGQGHTLDSLDISKVKDDAVSSEQVIEQTDLILSSQSGDELFNERPWQTLLRDLEDDGQDTLQRFSIASSLKKAKKKQLPRGKILFVMAVIESLEWPGKDASVTLKDTSGTIQGTIHQSVMKEYEGDLQPGSVLVLRQVSVISPTARNHYLNITPANVVCVYCNKSEGLSRLRFVDKDKPLSTVLKDLERAMMTELTPQRPGANTPQSRLNMGTPDIRTPQSRLNMGTPGIGNPQSSLNMGTPGIGNPQSRLNMGTPDIRTPQSRLNMGTPNIRTPQSRLNMGTPGIGNPQSRLNMGTPTITNQQSRLNMGTPNITNLQSRLNTGTPDIRNPQQRFSLDNIGNNGVTPPKSYAVGARTPGIGLSGVQGAPVSRTGSVTPQIGPSQSVISGNNGTNIMGVGVTRPPVGVSISKTGSFTTGNETGQNFTPQRFSTPDPRQRTVKNNSIVIPQIHMPQDGKVSYNSGQVTPRTPDGGAGTLNRIPLGGAISGNSTPQGVSAPGNRTPQGGGTAGCRGVSVTPTTAGVNNLYRFEPQNGGQNTSRSRNPSEGNRSNFQNSETTSSVLTGYNTPKYLNKERTGSGGVCGSLSPLTNSHVTSTGQCRVSSSSAVSSSALHSVINGANLSRCNNNGQHSDNVNATRASLNNNTTPSAANTPNRKGFKFKSTKSLTSPDSSLGLSMGQKSSYSPPGGSTVVGSVPSMCDSSRKSTAGVESLWQDDLSDDLLSQLSEELL